MPGAFGPLRALGERQLQIQFTLSSMYDTQVMGILALNAALLAAAIAAKGLLGHLWWLALIGLLASSAFCVLALGRTVEGVGPKLGELILQAPALNVDQMDEAVTTGILKSINSNAGRLRAKRVLIYGSLVLLGTTIAAAIVAVLAL
jgi:NaMN:DMB phosphoribosyltransferase